LYLCLGSCTVPDEESILTLDGHVGWIIDHFPIYEIVEALPTTTEIALVVGIVDEITLSDTDRDIRKEVSPGCSRHMDMDELSMVIVEMDAVLRLHSLRDIAAGDFFHVSSSAEVTLYPIDIYSEVGMMVSYVWTRCRDIRDERCESECDECEDEFFHSEYRLVDRLDHDLETSDREPDHSDETRFQYTEKIQCNHRERSECQEHRLSYARVHREDRDVTTVVDFFYEKNNWCQYTRSREEDCYPHE
jgi:hypothetical protein